jgi:hypothetical protein
MNKKIGRNFEVFTPCDSIAAITQHIPNKSFQLVRYYGWYSNKMRRPSRRTKKCRPRRSVEGVDVSAHEPRRILFQEVARVDQKGVGSRSAAVPEALTGNAHRFAHRRGGFSSSASCAFSGSGKRGWACNPAPTRRAKRPSIHGSTAPSRLRHRTGHGVLRHLKPSGSARVRLSHPLFSDPSPPATAFSGCGARTRKSPSLTSGSTFVTLRPMETHAFGFRPPANAPA